MRFGNCCCPSYLIVLVVGLGSLGIRSTSVATSRAVSARRPRITFHYDTHSAVEAVNALRARLLPFNAIAPELVDVAVIPIHDGRFVGSHFHEFRPDSIIEEKFAITSDGKHPHGVPRRSLLSNLSLGCIEPRYAMDLYQEFGGVTWYPGLVISLLEAIYQLNTMVLPDPHLPFMPAMWSRSGLSEARSEIIHGLFDPQYSDPEIALKTLVSGMTKNISALAQTTVLKDRDLVEMVRLASQAWHRRFNDPMDMLILRGVNHIAPEHELAQDEVFEIRTTVDSMPVHKDRANEMIRQQYLQWWEHRNDLAMEREAMTASLSENALTETAIESMILSTTTRRTKELPLIAELVERIVLSAVSSKEHVFALMTALRSDDQELAYLPDMDEQVRLLRNVVPKWLTERGLASTEEVSQIWHYGF